MKLINQSGIPEILVRAIENDTYSNSGSDYSATSLLKPPRIAQLTRKHWDDLEEDVESRLWSLYGQIVHLILERAGEKNDLTEKRYFVEVLGKKVSAQVDHLCLQSGTLTDWKFSTAYKFKTDQLPPQEWEAQLNIQCFILENNGFKPKELQIVGLLRDFSILEAKRNESYPKHPVVIMPIQKWGQEKTLNFIRDRILVHEKAKTELPDCTPEERWQRPTTWAHMKKGRDRALKLYYQEPQINLGPGEYIEYRPGVSVRCENYCPVSQFCDQFKKIKETQ